MAVSGNAVLSLNYFDAARNAQNTMFFAVIAQLADLFYRPNYDTGRIWTIHLRSWHESALQLNG